MIGWRCILYHFRDGKSRKFGFIGFEDVKDAKQAKHHFDGTYIDTSKISVEYARPLGDESIPRPWSKYSEGSSKHSNLQLKDTSAEEKNRKRGSSDLLEDELDVKRRKVVDFDKVADTGRLFLRNLPFTVTENDLRHLFSRFGTLNEVHITIDKETKMSKGVGFVTFMFPGHAVEALRTLDGSIFKGRLLHILPSEEPPEKKQIEEGENTGFVSEYQKKKTEKLKEMANKDYNWNTLFIRVC